MMRRKLETQTNAATTRPQTQEVNRRSGCRHGGVWSCRGRDCPTSWRPQKCSKGATHRPIKAGKAAATVSEAEVEALTIEEYYVLSNITNSFASDWYDETYGNLLWAGTADGKGARTVEDAFAAWKQRDGKFNCSGLRSRFNKDKAESLPKSQWTIETNLKQERQDE
jgi:hypothetical protein